MRHEAQDDLIRAVHERMLGHDPGEAANFARVRATVRQAHPLLPHADVATVTSAVAASSTVISVPLQSSVVPADRDEAK